jgi:mono/diheme cytochrome c family protein
MKRFGILFVLLVAAAGCSRQPSSTAAPPPAAYGAAIVASSGDKQIAAAGVWLEQPVVVQVNDAQGNAVAGALVAMEAPAGVVFSPSNGLTDSSGQFTSTVALGGQAGRYQLRAVTRDRSGKRLEVKLEETAMDYQQVLGHELNLQYCDRCHNSESTAERVSNYDNLTAKPHAFSEGDALSKLTDEDLAAIISHGGPALGRSAEMPPWGYTLSRSGIQALIAYIRAVSDPPYRTKGVVYARNRN